jgi:bacterial/archaeal transporter family protein
MSVWLLASVGYALLVGTQAIMLKLSLRSVTWPTLLIPVVIAYVLLMGYFLVTGKVSAPRTPGPWLLWVGLTGAFTAGAFPLVSLALQRAPASQVIPITAAYPIVTALLGAVVLAERLTAGRVIGIVLVVGGSILVAR